MFSRRLSLSQFLSQLLFGRGKKARRTPARQTRRPAQALDRLEARTLLSAVVTVAASGKSASYEDVDGDTVTVAVSVGQLTTANFITGTAGEGLQLETLDLTTGGSDFEGANISVTVKRAEFGDGLVDIGYIKAGGFDLGTVTIPGDLGRIDAGTDSASTPAIKSLSVRTLGRDGLDSQGTINGTTLASNINGALTTLTVKEDIQDSFINVTGAANGKIGAISVGGSLIGGSADHSGEIIASGGIGTVKVGADLQGGGGLQSGSIVSQGSIGTTSIGGSLLGSAGDDSGTVLAGHNIGAVTVGGDLRGRSGSFSGAIQSTTGAITSVKVGGSLLGSTGTSSGSISASAALGTVSIGHDVQGASGPSSASIQAGGAVTSVTIGGSLSGNSGDDSGLISAGLEIGSITVKGDIRGSSGTNSAAINGESTLGSLAVGGSVLGGSGAGSGQLVFTGSITKVTITGDLRGGSVADAGLLSSTSGQIGAVTIGGSLIGGSDANTGEIFADTSLGAVKIGGDIHGGSGAQSGIVESGTGKITSVSVGGSILGGVANQTGEILSGSDLGAVTVGGSLSGSGVAGTASLDQTAAIISTGRLTSVTIGGSIISGGNLGTGTLTNSGTVRAGKDIGSLTVKGSLIGNENTTASTMVVISAFGNVAAGAKTDVAIGKVSIGGHVQLADILAGYDTSLNPLNADAQIGSVSVGGDWVDSDLAAGVDNTASGNLNFGDGNDAIISGLGVTDVASIHSKITSVTIGGVVFGGPLVAGGPTNFGFVAESFGSFKIEGLSIPAATAPATFRIPPTDNVEIHEV